VRLFLAVNLSEDAIEAAGAWMRALSTRLGPRRTGELKLVEASQLHLTIHFFGEVPEPNIDKLRATLSDPLRLPPYELETGAAGTFPSSGQPRVLWLAIGGGRDETIALHDAIQNRLAATPLVYRTEARPFAPHLTVARVRHDAQSGLGRDLARALRAEPPPATRSYVDRATLYRSHPSPRGSRYEAICHAPLV
jgi:2'-5' RNA ligase